MVADGQVAGRLEVIVESDVTGFGERLKAALAKETAGVNAKVGVEVDSDGLRERIEAVVSAAAAGVNAKIGVEVDNKALEGRLKSALGRAGRRLKPLKVATETDNKLEQQVLAEAQAAEAAAAASNISVPIGTDGNLTMEVLREIIAAELAARAAGGVDVPLNVKPGDTLSGGSGGISRTFKRWGLRAGMAAALASFIQPVVGSLVAGVGGLTAMAAAAAPAINTVVGIAPGIASFAQTAIGLTTALGGTGEAIKLLAEKEKTLAAGGEFSAEQQKQLTAALEALSPAARAVVKDVVGLRDEWGALKDEVQQRFFEPLVGTITPLATTLLPTLRKGLAGTGAVLGKTASRFTKWFASPMFNDQFGNVLESNNGLIAAMGDFLFNASKGMLAFLDAARPFTARMAENIKEAGEWFNGKMQAGNRSGSIAEWLDRSADRAGMLWRILKQIGGGLRGIFKAGDATGMRLLTDLEEFLTKWNKWVNSPQGQRTIRKWFRDIEPTFRELANLAKQIGEGMLKWAADPKLAGLLEKIGEDLLPALGKLLKTLSDNLTEGLVDLITSLVEALVLLAPASEAIGYVFKMLAKFIRALTKVGEALPQTTELLATLLGLFVAYKGLAKIAKIAAAISGLAGAFAALRAALKGMPRLPGGGGGGPKTPGGGGPKTPGGGGGTTGGGSTSGRGAGGTGSSKPKAPAERTTGGNNNRLRAVPSEPETRSAARGLKDVAERIKGIGTEYERSNRFQGRFFTGLRGMFSLKGENGKFSFKKLLGKGLGVGTVATLTKDLADNFTSAVGGDRAGNLFKDLTGSISEAGAVTTDTIDQVRSRLLLGASNSETSLLGRMGVDVDELAEGMAKGGTASEEYVAALEQIQHVADPANISKLQSEGIEPAMQRIAQGMLQGGSFFEQDAKVIDEFRGIVDKARTQAAEKYARAQAGAQRRYDQALARRDRTEYGVKPDFIGPVPKGPTRKAVEAQEAAEARQAMQLNRQRVGKFASEIQGDFQKMGNGVSRVTSKAFKGVGESIGKIRVQASRLKGADKGVSGLGRSFTQTSAKIRRAGATIERSARNTRKSLSNMLDGKGLQGKSGVVTALGKVDKGLNRTKRTSTQVSRAVTRSMQNINRGGSKAFQAVGKSATQGFKRVENSAKTGMRGAVNAIQRAKGPAGNASKGVADATVKPMKGLNGQMSAAGAFAMAGLESGIRSAGARAVAAAQAVAAQVAAATRSALKVKSPSRVMAEIGRWVPAGLAKGITDNVGYVVRAGREMGKKLLETNVTKQNADESKKNQDRERANDEKHVRSKERNNKRLAEAQRKLSRLKGERSGLVSTVKESFKDFAGISSISDAMGGYASPTAVLATLRDRLKQSRDYRDNLKRLRKRGLGKTLYKQLLEMGVEAGAPIVEQLKNATPKQLKRIQKMQAELAKVGSKLGKKAGDQLYGAGIRAANALVNRLKKRRKEIDKALDGKKDKGGKGKKGGGKKGPGHGETHGRLTNSRRAAGSNVARRGGANQRAGDGALVGELNQYIYDKQGDDAGREVIRALRRARLGGVHG